MSPSNMTENSQKNDAGTSPHSAHFIWYVLLLLLTIGLSIFYLKVLHHGSPRSEQVEPTTSEGITITPLGKITGAMVGKVVFVKGIISEVMVPSGDSKRPWTLIIADGTGTGTIKFWRQAYAGIDDKLLLKSGVTVKARVSVGSYQDKIELMLTRGTDIEFPSAAPVAGTAMNTGSGFQAGDATPVKVAEINTGMTGLLVKVTARVEEIKAPEAGSRNPYELVLKDGDKSISVVYWDTVATHLKENKPMTGSLIGVRGYVNVYQNKLQIKVNNSQQITLMDVTPPSQPAYTSLSELKINQINPSLAGQLCTVRGTLGAPGSIRGGVIYPLSDSSGSIKLVLWDKSVPGPARDPLTSGCHVAVSGKINDFQGMLEIVPANAESIRIEPATAQ